MSSSRSHPHVPDLTEHVEIDPLEWRWVFFASSVVLLLAVLPFVWAYAYASASGLTFMGSLNNPIDGASYLAKMRQGFAGNWLLHLPYTPEEHRGVFLYTFYLGLGQLARLLALPLVLVYHTIRLLGTLLMCLMLYQFVAHWTTNSGQRRLAWGLAMFSTGGGWLMLFLSASNAGLATPDLLTLPEAFPFQAAYTNAHFPWALAIGLWMAHALITVCLRHPAHWPTLDGWSAGLAVSVIVMVGIAPQMLIPIAAGYGLMCIMLWVQSGKLPRRELNWGLLVVVFGLPLVIYNLWAISSANPIIQAWQTQNIALSPPVWKYLVAFGPLLFLALIGLWGIRKQLQMADYFLIGWLASVTVMLYAPVALQRRFTIGLTVPLSILAGVGLWRVIIPAIGERWRALMLAITMCMVIPTTIFAIVIPLVGTVQVSEVSYYFLSRDETKNLEWLSSHAKPDEVVLASPGVSLFVPIYGPRVVYGHPFETVNAVARRDSVLRYYAGEECDLVEREGVDYIMVGPEERLLMDGKALCPLPGSPVFSAGEVDIYAVSSQ
jgi:hypothetical protein